MLTILQKEIQLLVDLRRAKSSSRFFKTGKGEYGEGDMFIGITVPQIRVLARRYQALRIQDIKKLVRSKIHEERLLALIIMTLRYPQDSKTFYHLYLAERRYVNNWDLVDTTAHKIIGHYLLDKPRDILYQLAKSRNLWERRIAIIATLAFIQKSEFEDTLRIATLLLHDPHDLIQKAVGWMLREVGKKDKKAEEVFLQTHASVMPRTMLRYAIEKFSEKEREKYLSMWRDQK